MARLVLACLALGASVGVYRWARPTATSNPVGVLRSVALRYPMLRADLPVEQFGDGCDQGDGAACTELGLAFQRVRDEAGVPLPSCVDHALYARACDGGHWRGCDLLARHPRGCGEPDLAWAESVLDRACRGAVFAACDALGHIRVRRRS